MHRNFSLMKKTPFVLLLLLSISSLFAQSPDYRVVKVSGTVESPRLKRALRTDDRIQEKDQLKFNDPTAYIIILHPEKGRKTIRGVPDQAPHELSNLLQSFLRPDKKNTGSRGLSEEYLEALVSSLKDTVLVLGNGSIPLDSRFLPLAAPAVVKARYQDEHKKVHFITISKEQSILLGRKELSLDHIKKPSRVYVQYFKKEPAAPTEAGDEILGYFVPLYVNEQDLVHEVKVVAALYEQETKEKLLEEVYKYLSAEYAPPHKLNLEAWLHQHKVIN